MRIRSWTTQRASAQLPLEHLDFFNMMEAEKVLSIKESIPNSYSLTMNVWPPSSSISMQGADVGVVQSGRCFGYALTKDRLFGSRKIYVLFSRNRDIK